jgi:hypothetical protein
LLQRLIKIQLTTTDDEFRWSLTQSGRFTVRSMYLEYLNDNTIYLHKYLWKMKVPLKTKVFMWFLHRKEILTKDNLSKKSGSVVKSVVFVIKRRPYNTCSFNVLLQELFGRLFICLSTYLLL